MEKLDKIRIEGNGINSTIYIGDKKISNISEIKYEHTAGNIPYITIKYVSDKYEINLNDTYIKKVKKWYNYLGIGNK